MPLWAWIVLGAGIVLLLAAAAVGSYVAWRSAERRYLLRLVGYLEALESLRLALTSSVERLADSTAEQIEAFAEEPDSVERRALAEVAGRSLMLVEELDTLALPASLAAVADALADAAFVVSRESGRVREEQTGTEVLDGLADLDLGSVVAYLERAQEAISRQCEACGLDDPAVYGGGLYL